ncbi:THO complex subunit 4D-like isoform X1 [Iris pallida]|uniref:THO complex subunit 4D-like isoform X1 n=1 Tax=Iris pallida TaxID=29817 RepID=A0AAX6EV19_IRIPA|nr:THO complex subunit 4D-like isoform X1 [Iris pallida]
MIKNRNPSLSGRGRGRGRGRGPGGSTRGRAVDMPRQGPLRVNMGPSAYRIAKASQKSIASFSKAKAMNWRHDLFEDSMVAAGLTGVETGTKLYISNLDYGVSNEDIKELFSEFGDLKRCAVHYDRNGRPSGSAEVMFWRRSDAMAALKRYNNVQLDGKAMKIEVVGSNLGLPVNPRVNVVGGATGRGRTVVMMPEFGRGGTRSFNHVAWPEFGRGGTRSFNHVAWSGRGGFQRGRGRGRGQTRGRGGRGRGKKQPVEKSAGDLDKDLETYHAEAMNTS